MGELPLSGRSGDVDAKALVLSDNPELGRFWPEPPQDLRPVRAGGRVIPGGPFPAASNSSAGSAASAIRPAFGFGRTNRKGDPSPHPEHSSFVFFASM